MTTHAPWRPAIERMLARAQDTAARVKEGFPHWADPHRREVIRAGRRSGPLP